MAAKSKSRKNTKQARTAAKKGKPIRKAVRKKPVAKKVKLKKSASRASNPSRKEAGTKTVGLPKKRAPRTGSNLNTDPFASQEIASDRKSTRLNSSHVR